MCLYFHEWTLVYIDGCFDLVVNWFYHCKYTNKLSFSYRTKQWSVQCTRSVAVSQPTTTFNSQRLPPSRWVSLADIATFYSNLCPTNTLLCILMLPLQTVWLFECPFLVCSKFLSPLPHGCRWVFLKRLKTFVLLVSICNFIIFFPLLN